MLPELLCIGVSRNQVDEVFSIIIAIIPNRSFCQMYANFPWVELIPKSFIQLQKEKEKFVVACWITSYKKTQALSRRSRAVSVKKCTKKVWCTNNVVVLFIKHNAFLTFSLPSLCSDHKVPPTWLGLQGSKNQDPSDDIASFGLIPFWKDCTNFSAMQ